MNLSILLQTSTRLIQEGQQVVDSTFEQRIQGASYLGGPPRYVDLEAFAKWRGGCANFLRMLGEAGETWAESFKEDANTPVNSKVMLGSLRAISESIENNLLISVEQIIRAETFEGLLEQADYLYSEGYFLAAGVLGRAVLEDHLRNFCVIRNCLPSKAKPTLNDFNQSLYKAKILNVTHMKHVESMAAVGNNAAHNKPELTDQDVERLLGDVRRFIVTTAY